MYYTIYKITNDTNNKIYIGCHKTKDINDNYMGSGTRIKMALKKYGIENFTKEILYIFDSPEEMFNRETMIVDDNFVLREDTYNLKIGGSGGWETYNKDCDRSKVDRSHITLEFRKKLSMLATKRHEDGIYTTFNFKGRTHSKEVKDYIGEINAKKQKGKGNSQYGKIWIHSLIEKRSMKIMKTDKIPNGWIKGRKMKF